MHAVASLPLTNLMRCKLPATLDPELNIALSLHNIPMPDDPVVRNMMLDRPFQFGDCPTDNLQGMINIARNAATILRAPGLPRVDVPVIAIGSGPSLARHIPRIRELQDRCLLIASVSAIKGLKAEGITAHLSSPVERTEDVPQYMPDDCSGIRFAGAPLVCKRVLGRFSAYSYVANADPVYDWCSLPSDQRIYFGSSTGTMAVALGCQITTGTVYLAGHDLAHETKDSHWGLSQGIRVTTDGHQIMGNCGHMVPTNSLWHRFAVCLDEYARMHGKVVNLNAADGIGAKITHAIPGDLPTRDSLPPLAINWGAESTSDRFNHWRTHARHIDRDARKSVNYMRESKPIIRVIGGSRCLLGTDLTKFIPGPNGKVFAYLMRGLYAQLSYQVRMRITSEIDAHHWAQHAIVNVLGNSRGVFEEIAAHASAT